MSLPRDVERPLGGSLPSTPIQNPHGTPRCSYAVPARVYAVACVTPLLLGWTILGPNAASTGTSATAATRFPRVVPDWSTASITTDPTALGAVAADTLTYLRAMQGSDPAAGPGIFAEIGVTEARMEATLALVAETAAHNPAALSDPTWLTSNFYVYAWTPDPADPRVAKWKLASGEIRLTRYLTTMAEGVRTPDATHTQALYADPGEPWRSTYTRARIMAGAYVTGPAADRATPLAWLAENDVHDAIMQGSAAVHFPDGTTHTYGVDVSNGIPYVAAHSGRAQDRYWYFKERPDGPRGWGPPGSPDIGLKAGVSVAGDVYNLGLGRLILLDYPEGSRTRLKLAVLADSGGAFQPNLCQLDWYGGAYPSHDALYAAWKDLPEHVHASVLVAKER